MSAPRVTPAFLERYRSLNAAQKQAVDTIDGPVMVIAGPGTGKTQILTVRIANILKETDTPPDAILALTFTESGVAAMRRRLLSTIGAAAYRVHIFTFHGFCSEVIRRFPDAFPRIIGGAALSDIEKIRILRGVIEGGTYEHLKPFGNDFHYVNELRQKISELKRENISPEKLREHLVEARGAFEAREDLYHTKGPHAGKMKGEYQTEARRFERTSELLMVYGAYEEALRTLKRYDFEDMIVEVVSALSKDEGLLLRLQEEYHYILADEHQDANQAQNDLLEKLSGYHERPNLFVVGDEKQAIFRFQGASLDNFLYFTHRFPDATVVTLTENYRSGQGVLDPSLSLMVTGARAEEHSLRAPLVSKAGIDDAKVVTHRFPGEAEESDWIGHDIARRIAEGVEPSEIAVLYRTNREAGDFVRALSEHGVQSSVESDQNALEDPEVRSFLMCLRAIAHFGEDEHMARVLHLPFLKVRPLDAYKIIRHARRERMLIADALRSSAVLAGLGLEDTEAPGRVYALLDSLAARPGAVPEVVGAAMRESGYLAYILSSPRAVELIEKAAGLMRDIEHLSAADQDYTLAKLLDHLALLEEYRIPITKELRGVPRKGAVRLMTAHRSKGLEFDYVYITRAVDGVWGGKRDRELFALPTTGTKGDDDDERRLLFVALTRARYEVALTHASMRDGKALLPTRFLEEIDPSLYEVQIHSEPLPKERALMKERIILGPQLPDHTFLRELFLEQGLSVTALNNYRTCPWRYFYANLIRIPMERTRHLHLGNAVHHALKRYFDARALGEKVGRAELLSLYVEAVAALPLPERDRAEIEARGREYLSLWYVVREGTFIDSVKTEYGVETVFPEPVEGVPRFHIRGNLDKIEFLGGSRVRVVDYKTGKPKSRNAIQGKTKSDSGDYWRQLIFYRLLLEEEGKYRFASGALDFIQPDDKGRFRFEEFEVTDADLAELKAEVVRVAHEIWHLSFWEKRCGEEECEYCALRELVR